MKIQVHNGRFHADDVFAAALCRYKYGRENVEIIRASEVDETCDLILDVGMKYDGVKYFDHHQADVPMHKNGVMDCACTLLAKHILSEKEYRGLMGKGFYGIAIWDNGQEELEACFHNDLGGWVRFLIPAWRSEESMDEAFFKAVDIAEEMLGKVFMSIKAEEMADEMTAKAKSYADGKILLLSEPYPWKKSVVENTEALYVIFESSTDRKGFMVQGVPVGKGTIELRKPLPKEWIEEKPKGCMFVHNGCHLAVFESLEDALNALNGLL